MKNTKKLFLGLLLLVTCTAITLLPKALLAETITDRMQKPIQNVELPAGGDSAEETALVIVGNLINVVLSLFGIIFFALMIYGGYRWMTASGRDEEITKAKDTIRSAIIGLIIVMLAYAITYFISTQLQNAVSGETAS